MNRRLWILAGAVALLTTLAQYIPSSSAEGHAWDKVPAFWALFGLAGTLLLLGAVRAGRRLIERKEDYYDEP